MVNAHSNIKTVDKEVCTTIFKSDINCFVYNKL